MERRRAVRYPVRLDCRFSPRDVHKATLFGETVNMSSRGVLVSIPQAAGLPADLAVGEAARVVLELPQAPYFRGCWLECACRVARVVEQSGANLVAFEVKRYQFRPRPKVAPPAPPAS